MPSSLYKSWTTRHEAFSAGQPIPKSLINAIRSALKRVETMDGKVVYAAKLSDQEWNALVQAFIPGESTIPDPPLCWAITPEQTEQGLRWLNGLPKRFRLFDPAEFSHFTFDGLRMEEEGGYFRTTSFSPVYRIHLKDGRSIAYTARPWMSRSSDKSLPPYEVV